MADVFVSYVSEDRAIAEKIANGLLAVGFSVWWDQHIRGGTKFTKEIERELDAAKVVLVLWSAQSVTADWVQDEAQQARDQNKLIPILLGPVRPPLGFRQTQALDFSGWRGDANTGAFAGLVESVRHFVSGAASSASVASAPRVEPLRGRWRMSKWWLGGGVAAVAAGIVALWILPHLGSRTAAEGHDGRIEIGAFEPLTKTEELERFGKGIADTLIRVLATNGIKTVARDQGDAGSTGASPGSAEFALRGRVERDGGDLVASADLVNRRDGLVLWSFSMRRDAALLSIFREQFAVSVADVLHCAFLGRKWSNIEPSADLFAQQARICEAFRYQVDQTPDLARRLVETAPQDAASYWMQAIASATVSTTPTLRGARKPDLEIARLRKVVYDSAKIATEMDPRFDPLFARAIVVDPAVGLAERERLLQKSITSETPLEGAPLILYAYLLEGVGRIRDARATLKRGINQEPLSNSTRARIDSAFFAAWLGDIDVARLEFDEMRGTQLTDAEMDGIRLWTELWFGDPATAKAIRDQVKPTNFLWGTWGCVSFMVDARADHTQQSEAEIERACGSEYVIVLAYSYFGYLDEAFRGIKAKYKPADSVPLDYWSLFMPHMRLVRADPRFMVQAARLGLVDYWLDTDQWPDFCTEEKLPYDCKEAALAARAELRDRAAASTAP